MLLKVLTGKLTFESLKPCDLSSCTKKQIRDYFENSYNLNESLFTGLKDESALYKCPDRLRLPLVFYYGHTACVYVNKLVLAGLLKPEDRVNLNFETMFETGVDEMSWDDTENYRMGGKFEWPSFDEVVQYRKNVRHLILELIEDTPLQLPITMESPWWALIMGMEHERIHIETSSVLLRQMPIHLVVVPNGWNYAPVKLEVDAGPNQLVAVGESEVRLGKPRQFPSYGWDNEYGDAKYKVPAFEASKYPVTNRQFAEFVRDEGYGKRQYWSDEGWNWVSFRQAHHPTYWVCDQGCKSGCGAEFLDYSHCVPTARDQLAKETTTNNPVHLNGHQGMDEAGGLEFGFRLRCVYSVIDMPWDWPAEVNYHEAKAFCAWKGPDYRLPAEAEHQVLRGEQKPLSAGLICDIIFQDNILANLNMQYGSSSPVHMYPASSLGFYDVGGNVWEWTEDHFNGLPGFKSSYLYDDFSSPCFDGRHTMIMGGSWISTGDEASRFARFAFRRHFFQHAGFRLVRTAAVLDNGKVHLPIRTVSNKIFVQGIGTLDNEVLLDEKKFSYDPVESTFSQYLYETEEVLNDTLRFEYAAKQPFATGLVAKVTELLTKYDVATSSIMHLGCGTGLVSFKLAQIFDKVLGLDYCALFINTCLRLQDGHTVHFNEFNGFQKNKFSAVAPAGSNVNRIVFKQLTWLPNEVESHDLILISFVDRVQNQKAWLARLPEVTNDNGLVAIASAGPIEQLAQIIGNKFTLLETDRLPFTDQGTSAHFSVWIKANEI